MTSDGKWTDCGRVVVVTVGMAGQGMNESVLIFARSGKNPTIRPLQRSPAWWATLPSAMEN
jgi:hypothetical protein